MARLQTLKYSGLIFSSHRLGENLLWQTCFFSSGHKHLNSVWCYITPLIKKKEDLELRVTYTSCLSAMNDQKHSLSLCSKIGRDRNHAYLQGKEYYCPSSNSFCVSHPRSIFHSSTPFDFVPREACPSKLNNLGSGVHWIPVGA